MANNTITLQGFREFGQKLKNMPKVIEQEVSAETLFAAKNWEERAIKAAPNDQGRLKNEIRGFLIKPMDAEVVVNVQYAGYIEWGTKIKVSVPSSIASYAATFKGKGKGNKDEAKKAIFAWMKRVGIAEEFQYAVFHSIMTKGINPHPFFFIQATAVRKEFIANVRKILSTEH